LNLVGIYRHLVDMWLHFDHSGDRPRLLDLMNIFEDWELTPESTLRKFRIVRREGAREVSRLIEHYNLDAILAVGYRVRSPRGVQFRRWATERLP
jgi:hypothetical protein